ncbi:unnamed protein product [Auanema sp. JU1783]|nr:unnamed protein product [Auanema sp. JU1783]
MLYKSTIVAVVVMAGLVMAGPGGNRGGPGINRFGPGGHHGGPREHLPPFAQNATTEAKQALIVILRNDNITIAEQKSEIQTWAQTYGLTQEVNDFEQKMNAKIEEIQRNATEVVETLPTKLQEITAILSNENQTRRQQGEALKTFRDENPQAARALEALVRPQRPPRGGRPEGGRGRPEGGKGRPFEPMTFESEDEQ